MKFEIVILNHNLINLQLSLLTVRNVNIKIIQIGEGIRLLAHVKKKESVYIYIAIK